MLGAGLLVVAECPASPGRVSMLDVALNATRFFRNESCGKCVPCRIGLAEARPDRRAARRAAGGRPTSGAGLIDLVGELQETMEQTSICGLGTSAAKPLASLFEHDWHGTCASPIRSLDWTEDRPRIRRLAVRSHEWDRRSDEEASVRHAIPTDG